MHIANDSTNHAPRSIPTTIPVFTCLRRAVGDMVINTNPSKALVTLAVLTVTVVVALVLIFVAVPAMRGPLREQGSQISFRT